MCYTLLPRFTSRLHTYVVNAGSPYLALIGTGIKVNTFMVVKNEKIIKLRQIS